MRTTIDISEDVLAAARAIADHSGKTMGEVISELARKGLEKGKETLPFGGERNGVELFPSRADKKVVTPELIENIRDKEGNVSP